MPPLEWTGSVSEQKAECVVPGYGRVMLMIQDDSAMVLITTVFFPEPPGHEPETVARRFACNLDGAKILCQRFVNLIVGFQNEQTSALKKGEA